MHQRSRPLREVAQSVVMVARKPEEILYPEPDGYTGVGVVTPHHEDHRVDRQQRVDESGEREPTVRCNEYRCSDQDWENLEPPGAAVSWRQPRQNERYRDQD